MKSSIIDKIIVTLGILFLLYCAIGLIRNTFVLRYRMNLIDRISTLNMREPEKDGGWRWKAYDRVNYKDMLLKFWKPLDSFYPDKRFLQDEKEKK